ncbi:putative reverse transcriptase domain-containing protein [Tanacetum coccineum]
MDAIIARTWNLVDRSLNHVKNSPLSNTIPSTVDTRYSVELADGRVIGVDTIIEDYELNFLNPLFMIDLIPIEPGSFDVIIGMNWLRRYHTTIIHDKKIVRKPLGDETLTTRSNRSNGYASIVAKAFMDLMNRVYKPYLVKFVIVFIDDISIAQANKEYEEHIRLILGLLKNKELYYNDTEGESDSLRLSTTESS